MNHPPVFVQEEPELHARRALSEWLRSTDQESIHQVSAQAADAAVVHATRRRLTTVCYGLASAVGSELLGVIFGIQNWLRMHVSLSPFFPPESFEGDSVPSVAIGIFPSLAEYFRGAIPLPNTRKGSSPCR